MRKGQNESTPNTCRMQGNAMLINGMNHQKIKKITLT